MRTLVIVRPQPDATSTAQAARESGLDAVAMPLFAVEAVAWQAPDSNDFDALLLTSANVLRHGGEQVGTLRRLAAYCVGEATAAAAREAGLTVAAIGERGVDALLQRIPPQTRLLHLCGVDRHGSGRASHATTALAVYRSAEIDPGQALARAEGAVVALHSPRAAAVFARRATEAGLRRDRIALAAISKAAADAAGQGWERIEIASEPTDSAILAIAARLCQNPA